MHTVRRDLIVPVDDAFECCGVDLSFYQVLPFDDQLVYELEMQHNDGTFQDI